MSREANINLYMNRRCEPMGGELDTNNRNIPNVGRNDTFNDSSSEDNFIDELTLKVRSLLKSWEDDDSASSYKIDDCSSHSNLSKEFQVGKSTSSSKSNFSSRKIVTENRISNELKYHCNDPKFNPVGSFSDDNTNKTPEVSSFVHQVDARTLPNSSRNVKEVSKCVPLLTEEKSHNRSEFKDRTLNHLSTSIKKMSNYEMDGMLQSLKKISTPVLTVEDPISYHDFSNPLQGVSNTSSTSKNNFKVLVDKSVLESSGRLSERNSKQSDRNLKSNSSLSTVDLHSRESSDKETERSWSEITIVAESYSESLKNPTALPLKSQNDFHNENSSQSTTFENPSNSISNPFNSGIKGKENIKKISRSTNIYGKDINVSSRDWRIEITDHDKTSRESDKEYQFSDFLPNSSVSDLDQIDHDTPPLSASSMASSKRLEWDNGADIGYNVADMKSKVKYRSIPRSEPEGISFINEMGTNTVPSKMILPSFASMSSQDEPVPSFASMSSQDDPASIVSSHLEPLSCETSSMHEPSVMEDLLERSSSPGSLSRSDSKKSVIYNSFKNTPACDKAISSSDQSFNQTRKNSSWPDLTLKSSVPAVGWQTTLSYKSLSKSDEVVGLARRSELHCKRSHFPVITTSDNIDDFTDSSYLPERILPIGDCSPSESQSASIQNSAGSVSHSCKNCHSPLSGIVGESIDQKSGDSYHLQEGDLESYEMESESPNINQTNDSPHDAEGDWNNETVRNSDFSYITELPELTDYQLQSFNSRPFLLLHHDSSRLRGSNLPNIVQNLFHVNNSGDLSTNGNLEVKPHIRWYPLPSTSNFQDIKNVSTQTSVSFVAKQQTGSLAQVSNEQKNCRDMSSEALETSPRGDSSAAQFNKSYSEILGDSNSLSTSMLSKHSANKGTVTPHINSSHFTPMSSEIATTGNKIAYCTLDQVEDNINLSKLSNPLRNFSSTESCLLHKSDVEKQKEMSFLPHSGNTLETQSKSVQYQPSSFFSDTRSDSDDSTYLHRRNVISQPPSKYIFSGDLPASFAKRRVGVGQCETSPESISSKICRENVMIQQDMETRNSSTENLSESAEKNESVPHSSKISDTNYSNSVFSRFVSTQFDSGTASYDHMQSNFKHTLDDTVPLAFNPTNIETALERYNSSLTIPLGNVSNPYKKVDDTPTDYDRRCRDVFSNDTNHFIQTKANLSQILSENPSFFVSRQQQNSVIHKSHSDPLISFQSSEVCEEDETLSQSQLPSVNRRLDFEFSAESETGSGERISCVETSLVKDASIKDNPVFHQSQNSFSSNILRETASDSLFYKRISSSNESPFLGIKNVALSSNLFSNTSKFARDSHKSLLKEQSYLSVKNEIDKTRSIQRSFEDSDVLDEVHQVPTDDVLSRFKYSKLHERNYASVGIQVTPSISGLEICSFCHKTKNSHLNCCLKKEVFKSALNRTLAKRMSEMKSKPATSFCVFQTGCYCCCNKTLQEAFNFHRSEIVERIELRKKEVEEKCKKKLFLHAPSVSQTKPKQSVVKLNLKPTVDLHGKTNSNKENKRIKKSESSSWRSASSQKGRQRNLNKYNRVMSKIYSQRLKNETLKGKVNHQRHEILINS